MGTKADQKIGERLTQRRTEKGLTQAALADAMRAASPDHKWSQATVWGIEKGDRSLKASEVADLSKIIGGGMMLLVNPSDTETVEAELLRDQQELTQLGERLDQLWGDLIAKHTDMTERLNQVHRIARGWQDDPDWQSLSGYVERIAELPARIVPLGNSMRAVLREAGAVDFQRYLTYEAR